MQKLKCSFCMVNTCCENKYHKSFAPTILVPTNNQNVYAPRFYFRHFLRLFMIPSQKNISNRVKFKDVFRNTSSVIILKKAENKNKLRAELQYAMEKNLLPIFQSKVSLHKLQQKSSEDLQNSC